MALSTTSRSELATGRETTPPPFAPIRLRWALAMAALYHGGLLALRSHERTYDAFVHIFLGDHYARDWFSTWEQRWYTGFTTVSYPPGTHQSIAAVAKVVGDLELAFIVIQLAVVLGAVVGTYRFSRIWTNSDAAATAALIFVVSSSIAETVHLFGQLPTIWALCFLLNALPFLHDWLDRGRMADLVSGTALLAACTAGHHVTTLFGSVFFLGPIVVLVVLNHSRRPGANEPQPEERFRLSRSTIVPLLARRLHRAIPSVARTGVLGVAVLATLVVVVLPYWIWSASDPITQISIPHGSRENFIAEPNIGLVFFLIPWGVLLFVLPYALAKTVVDGRWPLAASLGLLTLLGTGGTTPIPRLLLGGAFDILTLDRFTFWATILILPVAGELALSLERGPLAQILRRVVGTAGKRAAQIAAPLTLMAFSIFAATLSQYRPFQPDRIDVDPIADFIEKDQHERWRFLTLGFGDQMAWLSAQTTATQVDGNYHSARRLPELVSTSVERLEGAKYRGVDGLGSLQQFLEVPEKYNLKFVFSNDPFYDPLLHFAGWQRLGPLENGVVVWERVDIPPLPAQLPVRELPPWQRIMWGLVPPGVIVAASLISSWNLLGRPRFGLWRPADRQEAAASHWLIVGPVLWLDRWLAVRANRLGESDAHQPQLASSRAGPFGSLWIHRLIAGIGAATIAVFALMIVATTAEPDVASPEGTIERYYDHLDFRRWNDAYALLDPDTRPDYELWRLQQSVNGGVVSSYAKLDSLQVTAVNQAAEAEETDGSTVEVEADLVYLTALSHYPTSVIHTLTHRDGEWRIEPAPADPTVPPEQLVRQAEVSYKIQGRRRVTSETTELSDVQDRPELDIDSANLLSVDGHPAVVGRVTNRDVDPADITVTAVLRNSNGDVIARYNATEVASLTLLPRESTPFRISFEEVAAGDYVEFDPVTFEPLTLSDEIAAAELVVKGVVTDRGLYRGLAVSSTAIDVDDSGQPVLHGEIYNSGVVEAVIPRLLISFLDDQGDVIWVQNEYLDYSVRPRRARPYSVVLDDPRANRAVPIEIEQFDNGVSPVGVTAAKPSGVVTAPAGLGYSSIDVVVTGFLGPG